MRSELIDGTVVRVPVLGGLAWHYGVLSGYTLSGQRLIISASRRRGSVVEETVAEFAQGGNVQIVGFPGALTPDEVVRRARLSIGQPWTLLHRNCEHYVRWFHGLAAESPQVDDALRLILATMVAVVLVRS